MLRTLSPCQSLSRHLGYQSSCNGLTVPVCKFAFIFLNSGSKVQEMAWICQGNLRMIPTSKEVKVLGKETQSCMLRVLHPGHKDTFYSGRSQEEKCSCDFVMLSQRPAHVGLALYGQGPALSVASGVL